MQSAPDGAQRDFPDQVVQGSDESGDGCAVLPYRDRQYESPSARPRPYGDVFACRAELRDTSHPRKRDDLSHPRGPDAKRCSGLDVDLPRHVSIPAWKTGRVHMQRVGRPRRFQCIDIRRSIRARSGARRTGRWSPRALGQLAESPRHPHRPCRNRRIIGEFAGSAAKIPRWAPASPRFRRASVARVACCCSRSCSRCSCTRSAAGC